MQQAQQYSEEIQTCQIQDEQRLSRFKQHQEVISNERKLQQSQGNSSLNQIQTIRKSLLIQDTQLKLIDQKVNNDGSVYSGQIRVKDGVMEGYGKLVWPNKNTYQGYFQNGKLHGDGEMLHFNGDNYKGQFENGLRQGEGHLEKSNGYVYRGEFYKDLQHGIGEETWQDGTTYHGTFQQGMKSGHGGILNLANGDIYEGEFLDGKMDGFGILQQDHGNRVYEGEWKDGKMHGKGIYTWKNEERYYKGEYVMDKKEGHGEYQFSDGRKYVGEWKNGKQHGVGFILYPNGKISKGRYENGKKVENLMIEEDEIVKFKQNNNNSNIQDSLLHFEFNDQNKSQFDEQQNSYE